MQELCKTCERRNQCKEVDNYDEYIKEHIRLREKSSLFDCEPSKCCLYKEESKDKDIAKDIDFDINEFINREIINVKTRNDFLETENRQLKDKIKTLQYINEYLAKKNRLFYRIVCKATNL